MTIISDDPTTWVLAPSMVSCESATDILDWWQSLIDCDAELQERGFGEVNASEACYLADELFAWWGRHVTHVSEKQTAVANLMGELWAMGLTTPTISNLSGIPIQDLLMLAFTEQVRPMVLEFEALVRGGTNRSAAAKKVGMNDSTGRKLAQRMHLPEVNHAGWRAGQTDWPCKARFHELLQETDRQGYYVKAIAEQLSAEGFDIPPKPTMASWVHKHDKRALQVAA